MYTKITRSSMAGLSTLWIVEFMGRQMAYKNWDNAVHLVAALARIMRGRNAESKLYRR